MPGSAEFTRFHFTVDYPITVTPFRMPFEQKGELLKIIGKQTTWVSISIDFISIYFNQVFFFLLNFDIAASCRKIAIDEVIWRKQ